MSNLQCVGKKSTLQAEDSKQATKSVERLVENTNTKHSTAHTDEASDNMNAQSNPNKQQHRKNSMSSGNLNDKFAKMFNK